MKFGVGVIGATGYIGTPYREEIRAATDDAEIVALCARRMDLLEKAKSLDGAEIATTDWREVVDCPKVNLVIVATPDALHYEPVLACAQLGKHMLCEKPTGVNVQQAYDMWLAYRDTGLGHYVPFWTRYMSAFVRARELVQEGLLGDVRAVIYRWHNPRPAGMPLTWRDDANLSSAGSIADVGSHAYDMMRWILGQEAVRLLAHGATITDSKPDKGAINLEEALELGQALPDANTQSRKGGTVDYAAIAFEMERGIVGSLILSHATYLRKGLAPEMELHGTEASLALDRISGRLTLARPGKDAEILETHPHSGYRNRFAEYVFPALRAQIAGEECHHPDLHDGYRVQLFTDAALLSARRGGWVELKELEQQ